MSAEYLFMAKPDEAVRKHLLKELERTGLLQRLGRELFDPLCWHQSLSGRFLLDESELDVLLTAGRKVKAASFVMTFNRVTGAGHANSPGPLHWQFEARGKPAGFQLLHAALALELRRQGVPEIQIVGNSPHLTLSYRAPESLKPSVAIVPFDWQITEFMLVRKRKHPFAYEPVERWTLTPPLGTSPTQKALF